MNAGLRRGGEWDPFLGMRELLNWDPLSVSPRLWRGGEESMSFVPAFDVKETKDAFVFKADLPGFKEQDVEVSVSGNRLTVSGMREAEKTEQGDRYFTTERSYGSFTRTFTLPDGVNQSGITAELKDGILTLLVPKTGETQPKRIRIGGGSTGEKAKA